VSSAENTLEAARNAAMFWRNEYRILSHKNPIGVRVVAAARNIRDVLDALLPNMPPDVETAWCELANALAGQEE
jgi:hypothetical protein